MKIRLWRLWTVLALLVPAVAWANQPPVADAGPDKHVIFGECAFLDGSAYDPDGDEIWEWYWEVIMRPAGSTADPIPIDYQEPLFCPDKPGEYLISLTVSDGYAYSAPDTVRVSATINQPPVAVATATPTSGSAPLTVQFDGARSSDPEGLALLYSWTFGDGSAATAWSTSPTIGHTYVTPGEYVAELTVRDHLGLTDVDIVIIEVLSGDLLAPVVTADLPAVVPAGEPFLLLGLADDSETGGSPIAGAAYSLDGGSAWSAMEALDGVFDDPIEGLRAEAPGLPVGVYTVLLSATDSAGNTGYSEPVLLPVYDPSAGFVTGGGWIDSPAGAFRPDLAEFAGVTGKATFGFVARYKKGADVPDGNTEFQFKAGDLNFKSTANQWLVVAGARAQFKGWGTINGEGDYGFLLTAIDGDLLGGKQPDRFRIKIWESADETIVYDNQSGTADTADLDDATIIRGGNIVIHAK